MLILIAGLLLFLGAHSISIVARDWRNGVVATLGADKWRGLYSILSLVGLVAIVYGYGLAREEPVLLWDPPLWTRHLSLVLMLPVFPLLAASSLPGRIRSAVKHPTLAAAKIWAFSHLIANGTLADLLLFGSFLAWAVIDRISVKRNPRGPEVGADKPGNDVKAVVIGLALYLVTVFYLHDWLIGVSPLP